MLRSRENYNSQSFISEFISTLVPGLIKRKEFIDRERILKKRKDYDAFITDINSYKSINSENELKEKIRDTILSLDNALEFISYCFTLLGNTSNHYVSDQDNLIFKECAKNINEEKAKKLAEVIVEIGFGNIINRENIGDYLVGLLVGFESDKRKNRGGNEFVNYILPELNNIISNFPGLKIKEEYNIQYGSGSNQNKRVDFAILNGDKCIIGIEVNFYTNSGSKPTEIKRSYGEVNRKLNELGIELVWITDGFGYNVMKKSLGDAREIHHNIYNMNMLKKYFKEDLNVFLNKNG